MKTRTFFAASAALNLAFAAAIVLLLSRPSATPPARPIAQANPSGAETSPKRQPPPSQQEPFPQAPATYLSTAPAPAAAAAFSFPRVPSVPQAPETTPSSSLREASANAVEESGDAADTSDVSLGKRQIFNPTASGNAMHFRGIRVALAETYQGDGNGGRSLGVDLSPEAKNASISNSASGAEAGSSSIPTAGASAGSGGSASGSTSQRTSRTFNASAASAPGSSTVDAGSSGFSKEDELFRMKWGWAAYDAARSEAQKEAGRDGSD